MMYQMMYRKLIRKPVFGKQAIRGIHTEFCLAERGYVLPLPNTPNGTYIQSVRHGNLIYSAGHLPQPKNGDLIRGKIGYHNSDNDVDRVDDVINTRN